MDGWVAWFTDWSLAYGYLGLTLFAFLAAFIVPVPTEAVLIPMLMLHPGRTVIYVLLASVSSTLAGWAAYGIGRWLGLSFLQHRVESERLARMRQTFQRYGTWAIGLAAFTPLPYNLFALAAGVARMPLGLMLLSAFIGRLLRFGLEGAAVAIFGEWVFPYLSAPMEFLFYGVVLLLGVAAFFFFARLRKKGARRREETEE